MWVLPLAVLLAAGAPSGSPEVLRVGMDTRSRPWASVPGLDYSKEDWTKAPVVTPAQLQRIEGVDIDVMKALAGRLGRTPRIVPWPWATIEQGLLEGRFDVILNAWSPGPGLSPGIVASAPYYEWGLLITVLADDRAIRSYKDVAGRRVGYFKDRLVDQSVRALGAGTLVPVDDSDLLFDQLLAGGVDAAIEDSTYVRWRVANDPRFRVVGERLNRHGYHVAVRREDRALLDAVQAAIAELHASGEIERIRAEWETAR